MFSFEALDGARNAFNNLNSRILELKKDQTSKQKENNYSEEFFKAMDDDLNTPIGLSVLWKVLKDDGLGNKEKYNLALEFGKVLGLRLDEVEEVSVPAEVQALVDEREKARAEKDFSKADSLRDKIKSLGYVVEDSKDGVKVKKVSRYCGFSVNSSRVSGCWLVTTLMCRWIIA